MKIFVVITILIFFIGCLFVVFWATTTEFKTEKETNRATTIVVVMLIIAAIITALFPVIDQWINNN